MKIILFALLVAACLATSFSGTKDGKISFDLDIHENSPIGMKMSGIIDPRNEKNNQIQAFVKLANQYIPVLQTLGKAQNEFTYSRDWHVTFMGVNIDIHWYFQLIVGWRASPGTSSASFYEVTYTPFVWGGTFGRINGTTWPAVGSTRAGLQYVHAFAPVAVTLYREGKICFGAGWVVEPISFHNRVFAALNECGAEIIDEIIDQQPIHLGCNYTAPVNFTLFNVNFTDTYSGDIIEETCITF